MSALGDTLKALAEVLDKSARERRSEGWYVFGAQAVAVRGAPRATQDVDVTVVVPTGELPQLVEELELAGLSHRYPESAEALLASAAVLPLRHSSGMEVDLVVGNSGLERLTLERAERIRVEEVEIPIARATELVVMKLLAGRGKDLDDVRALLAGGEVDEAEVNPRRLRSGRAVSEQGPKAGSSDPGPLGSGPAAGSFVGSTQSSSLLAIISPCVVGFSRWFSSAAPVRPSNRIRDPTGRTQI